MVQQTRLTPALSRSGRTGRCQDGARLSSPGGTPTTSILASFAFGVNWPGLLLSRTTTEIPLSDQRIAAPVMLEKLPKGSTDKPTGIAHKRTYA